MTDGLTPGGHLAAGFVLSGLTAAARELPFLPPLRRVDEVVVELVLHCGKFFQRC
ncbi:hypothetical protein G3I15_04805, partial [Streptomyces sp. SID10244]|nr:hypothetical protein [Streptomyces sp. SID10244]